VEREFPTFTESKWVSKSIPVYVATELGLLSLELPARTIPDFLLATEEVMEYRVEENKPYGTWAVVELFPGGTCNNQRAYQKWVDFTPGIPEETRMLLFTPETSGGLLIAVPSARVPSLADHFSQVGHPCWLIGEVVEGEGIQVIQP